MDEYLIYFKLIGTTSDRRYIYQLDFSSDSESAWGNGWAECPASNAKHMDPEEGIITSSYKITTPYSFATANRNNCFSMQDCIDNIIPLAYCIDNGDAIIFSFNNSLTDVLSELDSLGIPYEQIERNSITDNTSSIEDLVGKLNDEEDE